MDFRRNTGTGNNFASCHSSKGMTKQPQRSILPSGFLLLDGIGAFIFRILDTVTDRSEFIELFHLFSHHI
jgi:hypothetical protein